MPTDIKESFADYLLLLNAVGEGVYGLDKDGNTVYEPCLRAGDG